MAITAAQVKELREMTGAGMMDCKKALTATEGDMDKAVEFLREKGLATAQKKANRVAAEGLCKTLVADDAKNAVVVEVNSETDFVAKNEKFQQYVADVAAQALTTTAADIDAFLAEAWALDTTKTVKEALAAQIAVIGENMNIRRFAQMKEENGFVASANALSKAACCSDPARNTPAASKIPVVPITTAAFFLASPFLFPIPESIFLACAAFSNRLFP